jgi:hypothetical protein
MFTPTPEESRTSSPLHFDVCECRLGGAAPSSMCDRDPAGGPDLAVAAHRRGVRDALQHAPRPLFAAGRPQGWVPATERFVYPRKFSRRRTL